MIQNNQKTSLLIPSQLPEFVRDEPSYQKFVLFLQSYYEWMEQNGNVVDRSKNLLNYSDIDNTSEEFLDYFYNDFLSYFPKEILADKQKVIKLARELYQSKGTPSAYKFLFRVLYNSDVDFFYTKEAVLRPSTGKWYVAKSLKLTSDDVNFLNINNLRLFGETTKSIATVENSVFSGTRTEVFISNIERLFQSGEFVRVVDSNNQDVLFDGQPLRAKIVGQISQIKIDPLNRGLLYQPGDPVVVYGGLNSNTGHGADAIISNTTSGSIQSIKVEEGGFGYTTYPNTNIILTNAPGAVAIVGSLNPSANGVANVTFIPTDYIGKKRLIRLDAPNYNFSNVVTSNLNTTLAEAFTFTSFSTYPISSVLVQNGGGGINKIPTISAQSTYQAEDDAFRADLKNLGILAPIQILDAGLGYEANDTINIVGGTGLGANAEVLTVNTDGSILTVGYLPVPGYALGGMGYTPSGLPNISVDSANTSATGALLYIPGILGDGAVFTPTVDRVGSITSISITDAGEDYISAPNVSLKVQDMVVSGLTLYNVPEKGDVVYQGLDQLNSSYNATVESVIPLIQNADPLLTLYRLRVYNYNAKPSYVLPLKIDSKGISMSLSNQILGQGYDSTGVKTYGDGTAKANASFLNGLVISGGQYLDTTGQPSSFDVLQSTIYNNYTYEITVEKEIAKYREILLNLLHPTGMKVIGRYAMKSNSSLQTTISETLQKGQPLAYYTGNTGSIGQVATNWVDYANNVITFDYLDGADLTTFINLGDDVVMTTENDSIHSTVSGVTSDTVTLQEYKWLTFANVANITAESGNNAINIVSLTNSYDIINNGIYSDSDYPLKDIVFVGDKVLIANNTEKLVTDIDYINGIIFVDSNFTDDSISTLTVNRTFVTNNIQIFSSVE